METFGAFPSGGKVTPGGKVFNFGLCDARRFRGFGEDGG